MSNFLTALPFNASSVSNLPDSINPVSKLSAARDDKRLCDTTQKHHFHHLRQSEDKRLEFTYTIGGKPLKDIAKVEFIIFQLDGSEVSRHSLEDNVDEYAGVITVVLPDALTAVMVGKFNYELWLRDSNETDTLLFTGSLKFKPTSGRIV